MSKADEIKIEILEDGTISVSTDEISGENHVSADEFMAELQELAGGEVVSKKKKHKRKHSLLSKKKAMHAH